ncbi:MAG: PD40 domain-containing protein, partial [Cyanobacteria bacterium REEB65]|nr:PD40 domain-containing protein [Cyanobacteria bacterium REEB65]
AVPGAGVGIQNPQIFDGGDRVVFNRVDGTIWFYDLLTELLVQFNDVNANGMFVIRPSITQDGTVMTYVGVPGWTWSQGIAFIWINGVVAALSKVNAVGLLHGGITWIRISANGRWAVFTTGDGCLFTYDVVNPVVYQVTDANVAACFAMDPDISPDGSQIVWTGIGPDGSLKIFRYDRVAQLVDPMPFANLAMDAVDAFDPRFLGPDGSWIVYDVFTQSHYGGLRVLGYNWITEFVRTFTILNSVQGTGNQSISD